MPFIEIPSHFLIFISQSHQSTTSNFEGGKESRVGGTEWAWAGKWLTLPPSSLSYAAVSHHMGGSVALEAGYAMAFIFRKVAADEPATQGFGAVKALEPSVTGIVDNP